MCSQRDMVSVVVPTYNRAATLPRAVGSALTQNYASLELIIIDDGSTDNTREVVESIADPRIRYHFQANRGISAARNAGIRLARGRWIAFLDSDDQWLPGKIARQVQALMSSGAQLCYCSYMRNQDGETSGPFPAALPVDSRGVARQLICEGASIHTSSVVVDRAAVEAVGGFDETLVVAEDKDLWFRLACAVTGTPVPDVLVATYESANSCVVLFDAIRRAQDELVILRRWYRMVSDAGTRAAVRRRLLTMHATCCKRYAARGQRMRAVLCGVSSWRWGWSSLAMKVSLESMLGVRCYRTLRKFWFRIAKRTASDNKT